MSKTPQQRWNERNPEKLASIHQEINSRSTRITLRLYSDKEKDQALMNWLKSEQINGESLSSVIRRKLEKVKILEDMTDC